MYLFFPCLLIFCFNACQDPKPFLSAFPKAEHIYSKIPDFEVQQIVGGEGEFLSITTDPQGRFLVSPRKGKLLRFAINDAEQTPLIIDTLDVGVEDCQGVLHAYGHLYMMGTNRDTLRGVFRLKDINGQGNFGNPILLKEFSRNGDHSGHTLTLGPDGMIYFLSGNDNPVPMEANEAYVNANWQTDHLMPLKTAFSPNQGPPGGFVMRTDSLGEKWQLTSYGLRNPYDMCFSPQGELFTFDSDMEWDFNLPWYRPIRVNHLVSGGDYAWRQGTAKRFDYYPDIWPSVVDFGRGSPTATVFGTGTAFPATHQKALFVGDWSYGRIYAVHLQTKGATYTGNYEVFVSGQPLNITDMAVGKDGALYFTTGGNGTDTGLFRVIYKGNKATKAVDHSMPDKGTELRKLRKELEQWHFSTDKEGLEVALQYMEHPDRFIRNAARVILENNAPQKWINALEKTNTFEGKVTLLTALIRTDTLHQFVEKINDFLTTFDLKKLNQEQKLAIIRLYELYFVRNEKLPTSILKNAYSKLQTYFPADKELVNKELSRVLAYLASQLNANESFLNKTFELLESTKNPQLFIHYLAVLRKVQSGWTMEQRLAWQYWMKYAVDNLNGGALFGHFLGEIKKEFEQTLSLKEKRLLAQAKPKPLKSNWQGPVPPKPKAATSMFTFNEANYNWKMEDLQYSLELVSSPRFRLDRNFNRGKQLFQKGQCYNCHYMYDKGGSFGPDLTMAGNSFSVEDLLTAIIEPSKDINSRFQATKFNLKSDDFVVGRIASENAENYVLQLGYEPSNTEELYKKDVIAIESSSISEMPPGLINNMNREEVLDLLYFMIQVASKSKGEAEVAIHEEKTVFLKGDSSLVELIDYSNQADIHYTIDGTIPDENSPKYEQPFYVKNSTFIQAVAITKENQSKVQRQVIHAVDTSQNGLNWKLYRNIQEDFPDVSDRTPDATGVTYRISTNNIAEGENNFMIVYEGFIEIDKEADYTFYTHQDDILQIKIGGQVVTKTVHRWYNDNTQGTIHLTAAKHPIHIIYQDFLAREYVKVFYERGGMSKREVLGSQLFRKNSF